MEFKKPKPKKKCLKRQLILPLKSEREVTGVFNGQFVTVSNLESMNYLYEAGNFGKGTLSRGKPDYHMKKDDIPKIILQHQFENHAKWNAGASYSCSQKYSGDSKDFALSLQSISNLLQSSFNDSEEESWKSWKEKHNQDFNHSVKKNESRKTDLSVLEFKTDESAHVDEVLGKFVNEILQSRLLKAPKTQDFKTGQVLVLNTHFDACATDLSTATINSRLEGSHVIAEENLNLNLEESFFLNSELGCLNIIDLNFSELSTSKLWEKFNEVDKNFKERYVTYHYYRAKGWVVKSGLKFGGDFLLYKDGPAHYHSSYMAKVLDKKKKITWREFVTMNRLAETCNKDLILCNILPVSSSEEKETFPDAFTNNSIQEILVKRWFPSRERFAKGDKTSD